MRRVYAHASSSTFSSPEPLGLICNRPRFPTTWPRNDGLWGRKCEQQSREVRETRDAQSFTQCFYEIYARKYNADTHGKSTRPCTPPSFRHWSVSSVCHQSPYVLYIQRQKHIKPSRSPLLVTGDRGDKVAYTNFRTEALCSNSAETQRYGQYLTHVHNHHPGSVSHGQPRTFRPYWGSSGWHRRWVNERANPSLKDPLLCACVRYWPYREVDMQLAHFKIGWRPIFLRRKRMNRRK